MKIAKLVSFDLQGTLSDSSFSDEFWLELLPSLYAKKYQLTRTQAKVFLAQEFSSIGKYHELFYNHRLRLNSLLQTWEFPDIVRMLKNQPVLNCAVFNLIKKIPSHIPKIILSATTRDFIDFELGQTKNYFYKTISAIDDFNIPGKPPALYRKVACLLNVKPENCFHIGDSFEMDYQNAKKAGWFSFYLNTKYARHISLFALEQNLQQFLDICLV